MSGSGLVRLQKAAARVDYSVWTLRRWHAQGLLPLVKTGTGQCVPESFLLMLERSPRPGRAGRLEEIAAEWFALNSAAAGSAS